MTENKVVTVEVKLLHETDAAYKVASCLTAKVAWVPKSRSELDGDQLQVEEWLALEKGLV